MEYVLNNLKANSLVDLFILKNSLFSLMRPNKKIIYLTYLCVFLNKQEDLSRFSRISNIFKYFSTCQTHSKHF